MFCVEDYEVENEQARKQDQQNKQIVEAQGVLATLVHARQAVNPLCRPFRNFPSRPAVIRM
jgi:hypothetical protein